MAHCLYCPTQPSRLDPHCLYCPTQPSRLDPHCFDLCTVFLWVYPAYMNQNGVIYSRELNFCRLCLCLCSNSINITDIIFAEKKDFYKNQRCYSNKFQISHFYRIHTVYVYACNIQSYIQSEHSTRNWVNLYITTSAYFV